MQTNKENIDEIGNIMKAQKKKERPYRIHHEYKLQRSAYKIQEN